ncbi:MAG: glycosyltransferase family 4 protein [Thermodesulfobacteriota bacterium]|nr:glycosyltransferase family 4 protein [Thermodesulfobacteriota bacterium]
MSKILHIITRLDRGGSAENTWLTCHELANKYELILVHGPSLESRMTHWEKQSVHGRIKIAEERGVKVISMPSLVRRIDPLQDLRALFSLWRLFVREEPHIVHTHTSKAGILGRLAAKMAGVPYIVHTPHGHVFYGHFGPLASKLFLVIERLMATITDRMVALTEVEKEDYMAFSVCSRKKLHTIHSGVDIAPYVGAHVQVEDKKRALGLDPNALVVGTVGWLLPIKGPMYLLRAMKGLWQSHPHTMLVYVGKGDMEQVLKEEARLMGGSDRVLFLGWRDDIPEIMQCLDVFVLPSLNEGMGRVLVEAMAAGKPVVASRVGGILDLVKDGLNGFLVEPGNPGALCDAIRKLLSDKRLRANMGRQGRNRAKDFTVGEMIEKIDGLYTSVFQESLR